MSSAHLDWLRQQGVAATRARAVLDTHTIATWSELLNDPDVHTIAGMTYVLDQLTHELDHDPSIARDMLPVVLSTIETLKVPPAGDVVMIPLRGRALKIYAHTLRSTGDPVTARTALDDALAILTSHPAGALELAHARLLDAYLQHEQGEHGEALLIADEAARAYASIGYTKGTVDAQLMIGALRWEQRNISAAEPFFRQALELAQELSFDLGIARALANLGHCAGAREQDAIAMEYYARALPLFDTLDLAAERPRILWGMARVASRQGQLESALRTMTKVRNDFLHRGMRVQAALAGADVLDLLLVIKREDRVASCSRDLADEFSNADFPAAAIVPFAALAAVGSVTPQELAHVRGQVREALVA